MRQGEFGQSFTVHPVEQLELCRQLVGLLPLGGELGSLLVVVVVREVLPRVGVEAEGPESVQVDLVTYGRGQGVHQDPRAQPLRGQVLVPPVPGKARSSLRINLLRHHCSEATTSGPDLPDRASHIS